jgi:hypothetical protein
MESSLVQRNNWTYNANALYSTVDCRGLKDSALVGWVHQWVINRAPMMQGYNYVGSINGSRELFYSCSKREGFPCVIVARVALLGHIMQVCPQTWRIRNKRHQNLISLHQQVHGKPDKVVFCENDPVVCGLDVTICADNANQRSMNIRWSTMEQMRSGYGYNGMPRAMTVNFSSVTRNW